MKTQIINWLLIAVVLLDVCAMVGCHRGYYRRQADMEARRLVLEKATDARWNSSDGTIDLDPQSRMFDPFSADHPPIPPDDAASHQFMHCVDGKPGYPHWHANGDTDYVENPDWQSYLPINENGQVVLNLERAYQLALLHSPDLQEQRETLYLSALDVSLERFGFDSQLFAGFNSFFTTKGRLRSGSGGRSSSELSSSLGANGGGINLQRLGVTGTNFAVGLANTILFNFGGNNTQSATTLLDFSIIQPLLRGAGRDRIMESLTQSERTLLANVRQMDRFRRGFYLQVAIGRAPGAGPNGNGNFLGLPQGASTNVGGFFGLLLQQQQIRNQEFNVRQLEAVLEQFREFNLRDRLDRVQLKLFESNVYGQQSSLVEAKIQYQTAVDRFKQTIGLPPNVEVIIDDDFLDRFELISDQINDRLISIGKLREQTGSALNRVDALLPVSNKEVDVLASDFRWTDDLKQRIDGLSRYVTEAEAILAKIKSDDLKQLEGDFKKLDSVRDDRLVYLKELEASIESGKIISDVDPLLYSSDSIPKSDDLRYSLDAPENQRSLVTRMGALEKELATVRSVISEMEDVQSGFNKMQLRTFIRERLQETIPGRLSELNNILLEVSLLQAQARSNSIEIFEVDIDSANATQIARCLRRDWMNARASLVDDWRQIEFVADQLESQVDLVFEGDIGNNGDNPFKIRYETGQLRAGFRFDSPIVRVAERNQYRETLIRYQQSRRNFYQFEDEVQRNLRDIVRNISRNKVLFELNRRSVQVQIEQVELNRFSLEEPVGLNAGSSRLGTSTARNLTDAIIGLNTFQNRFLRTWVEYEVLRRSLDFDMGTMQLDPFGSWIDPVKIDSAIGMRAADSMGIELDCQFCNLNQFVDSGSAVSSDANFDQYSDLVPDPTKGTESQDDSLIEQPQRLQLEPSNPDNQPEIKIDRPQPKTEILQAPREPELNLNPPTNDGSYYKPARPAVEGTVSPAHRPNARPLSLKESNKKPQRDVQLPDSITAKKLATEKLGEEKLIADTTAGSKPATIPDSLSLDSLPMSNQLSDMPIEIDNQLIDPTIQRLPSIPDTSIVHGNARASNAIPTDPSLTTHSLIRVSAESDSDDYQANSIPVDINRIFGMSNELGLEFPVKDAGLKIAFPQDLESRLFHRQNLFRSFGKQFERFELQFEDR